MRLPSIESIAQISAPIRYAKQILSAGELELPEAFNEIALQTGVRISLSFDDDFETFEALRNSKTIVFGTHTGNGIDVLTTVLAGFSIGPNDMRLLMDKQFIKILSPHERYRPQFCSIPNVESQNKKLRFRTLVSTYQKLTATDSPHEKWTGWTEAKRGRQSVMVMPDGGQNVNHIENVKWPEPLNNLTKTADNFVFIHTDKSPGLAMLYYLNPTLAIPMGWLLSSTIKGRAVVSSPICASNFNDISQIQNAYYQWSQEVKKD